MNDTLTLLLAVHNHQPVGNFLWVFEKAFRDCYLPFFRLLRSHPRVRMTVHFSGPLWEVMREKERECWDLVFELAGRGQVELLGGGFYEPVLTIIPESDRQGQLRMMADFLEEQFGRRPRGIWLTERVWEPGLPKTLAEAGVEYTLLDEEHFRYAGVTDIHRLYVTEDEGRPLRLFPIDKKLRYLIPFRPLEEISRYFDEIKAGGGWAILGDDGEKFGLWPGTREWVYDEGWLESFFGFIEDDPHIQTRTFGEALDAGEGEPGRVYIPPASYEEMMEWVLEPAAAREFRDLKARVTGPSRRFLRGGFFREFFLKYPESDHLHKRMLGVSRKFLTGGTEEGRLELYKSQCNDPYWHGVFGGLYLPHLREAAYYHLLQAEQALAPEAGWQAGDFDADGRDELSRRNGRFGLWVKPDAGGALTEIDFYPQTRNLSDVLGRRPEAYHIREEPAGSSPGGSIHDLAKELPPEAEQLFAYDWHPRWSGLDHFLHADTRLEDFRSARYGEQGDFVKRPYSWSIVGDRLFLTRRGCVWRDAAAVPVSIQKEIRPEGGEVQVLFTITNLGDREVSLFFASEWNVYQVPEEFRAEAEGAVLAGGRLRFSFEPAQGFWQFPLQTLSQSEKGYDIIHQGYCLLPWWKIVLPAMAAFHSRIHLGENRDA